MSSSAPAEAPVLDVLTFGRSGVDIYPQQIGVGLEDVTSFGKYLGGTTANVAVAAARLGERAAIITGVGDDPFGRYVRRTLRELGVDDRHVVTNREYATPVTFCEIFPPDDFPLWFYRKPTAPDLQITPDDIDFDAVRSTRLLWLSVTGLSEEPSRASHFAVLEARARAEFTVLDLDYRPMFWDTAAHATEQVQKALAQVTVAVGNKEECEVAVGRDRARAGGRRAAGRRGRAGHRQAGPQGSARQDPDRAGRVPADHDPAVERARRRRQLRGLAGPRPAVRLAAGEGPAARERRRGDRRLPAGVLDRDADRRGDRHPARRRRPERRSGRPSARGPDASGRPPGGPGERRSPVMGQVYSPSPVGTGAFAGSVAEINEIRVREPERISGLLQRRARRPLFGADGRLMIVACDHPARGALSATGRPTAMADRVDLLERLRTALARPGVDGLLATADIAEDLLLLGALEGKVVFSSINRGGLQGASFELDDRPTAYDVQGTLEAGFDGAKMLTRIDLDDPGTVATLQSCAQAVTELNRARLVAMVEPFMSTRVNGKVVNDLSPEAVIKSVHIAQGLGASSAYTWMKLPVVEEMERVMASTTLPTLLLGGDPDGAPDDTYAKWQAALRLPSVRGLVVGRTMLYPADDDVAGAVDTAVSLVR